MTRITQRLAELGAKPFGERISSVGQAIRNLSLSIPIPSSLEQVLSAIGGAVIFENGARFTMDEASPLNGRDGYQNLEMIFGPGDGEYSLVNQAAIYDGELPTLMTPIGEAPGDNLLLLDHAGGLHLWNHESGRTWRIAGSFDTLLDRLEPEAKGSMKTREIVEEESYLDF